MISAKPFRSKAGAPPPRNSGTGDGSGGQRGGISDGSGGRRRGRKGRRVRGLDFMMLRRRGGLVESAGRRI